MLDTQPSAIERSWRTRVRLPFSVIEPLFVLTDCAIILASAMLAGVGYHLVMTASAGETGVHAGLGLVAGLTYAVTGHRLGIYHFNELLARERDHKRVLASWGLAVLVLVVALFLFKVGEQVSRGSVICFALLGGAALAVWRKAAKQALRTALVAGAIRGSRALLIGTQCELAHFAPRDVLVRFGVDEVERIVLPRNSAINEESGCYRAAVEWALERARQAPVEEIVLAFSWSDTEKIELLLHELRIIPLPVRLLPDHALSGVLGHQSVALPRAYMVEVKRAPLTATERLAKRALDVTVAAAALMLLSPLMIVTAVAIALESPGPVIFRQRRRGFNGQPFVIYKFRTMRVLEDGPIVVQATRKDPRVTAIGRLLRRASIDELPQLFNVLRGDMSIVGPRPHALVHDHEYGQIIANYAFRQHVKPGITGWAQVQGFRGGTPRVELMERRVALDLWYINNWSLGLDLQIILKTCLELLRPRAY